LFENPLTVQFEHRMAAYALWVLALLHAVDAARTLRGGPALTRALALFIGITIQAAVGVLTLVHFVPIVLALAHQGMAMVVLAIAVANARGLVARAAAARAAAPSLVPSS